MTRAALLLVPLLACHLPEPQLEGAHVRIAIDPGLAMCGDPLAHTDEFIALLSAELGRPPPTGDDRIPYYYLRPGDFDSRTICISERGGCAIGGDVYSTRIPHDHEVVHAVAWPDGVSAAFFIEGLAVAHEYSEPRPLTRFDDDADQVSSMPIAEAIVRRRDAWLTGEAYNVAGAFTAFLIEREGIDAYMRVYRRLQLADDVGLVSRALELELGASLATLAAEFDATRRECPLLAFNRKLIECSAPEIAWDGVTWADYRTLDCDQGDVIGPFATGTIVAHRTLVVPEDAIYTVDIVGDADGADGTERNAIDLIRCGGCEDFAQLRAIAGEPAATGPLTAGTYAVRWRGPAELATGVGVRVERQWLGLEAPLGE